MELPVRKQLKHSPPFKAEDAFFFITICALDHCPWACKVGGDHRAPRDLVGGDHRAPRTFPEIANAILDEARFFHRQGKWFVSIMTIMPDHLHAIVHGPPGGRPLPMIIGDFKRYLNRRFGIGFQADYFDTRIRDAAHYAEKWNYIVRNPVARDLVAMPCEWPYLVAYNRLTGEEFTPSEEECV